MSTSNIGPLRVPEVKRVIIGISGGVGFNIDVPKGVEVEIRDYDVVYSEIREDYVKSDNNGDVYQEIIFKHDS